MPATAPSGVGRNEYYKTEEEYFHAVAAALRNEYVAIVAAGFLLQVDDPFLPDIFYEPGLSEEQMKWRANLYVDATNAAIQGIPCERVRFHVLRHQRGAAALRSKPATDYRLRSEDQRGVVQLRGR